MGVFSEVAVSGISRPQSTPLSLSRYQYGCAQWMLTSIVYGASSPIMHRSFMNSPRVSSSSGA